MVFLVFLGVMFTKLSWFRKRVEALVLHYVRDSQTNQSEGRVIVASYERKDQISVHNQVESAQEALAVWGERVLNENLAFVQRDS